MPDPVEQIAALYPRFMKAMSHMRGAVDESMDLTYNQYKALLALAAIGPCTLNILSRDLRVATSSASQMVDRLVGMGLVDRSQGDGDRRQVVLENTGEGDRLIDEIRRGIVLRYRDLLGRMTPRDRERLAEAIRTLVVLMEKAMLKEEREEQT